VELIWEVVVLAGGLTATVELAGSMAAGAGVLAVMYLEVVEGLFPVRGQMAR
jgi:hypothetical protein